MNFYISATTDVGIKRTVNQDSLFVRRLETRTGKMVFAVLCDGMGGHSYGEWASAELISAFTGWMYTSLPVLSQKPLEDHTIREQWNKAAALVNERLFSYGLKNGCKVGSTLTVLLLTQNRYFLMNAGDTRAYEVADQVRQLTVDHTVIEKEIRLGNITESQAKVSPMRNVLTRCVGAGEKVCPDMFFGNVARNAAYMLCSDGFWHCIAKEEMREHLWYRVKNGVSGIKGQEEYLVELDKRRGETDNISVITIFTY